MLLKERTWLDENGDPCIEMMTAMEKMTAMHKESQTQLQEHKERMDKAMRDLEKGKMPAGVGPLAGMTQSKQLKPKEWEGEMPQSFPG